MDDSHSSRRKRSNDDSNDDSDGKKKRNRASARKCREKKVKATEELKKKNSDLVETNKALHRKKEILERQLQECIIEIQRHKQSGCILPENVASIINSSSDFCPVGVQITALPTYIKNSNDILTGPDRSQLDSDYEDDVTAEEPVPAIKGIFTGNTVRVKPLRRTKATNVSYPSPSKSPPAPSMMPANMNHMVRPPSSLSSSSSSKNMHDCTSPQWTQQSWTLLHQQTNGQVSPGLSPVQTVPNIDPDWGSSVSENYLKENGFPDIEEAVQHAQRDPGIMDDTGYVRHHFHHHQTIASSTSSEQERQSLQSFGFTPNLATDSSSSSQNNANLVHESNQQLSPMPIFHDSSQLTASSPMTVSMNHTAELLSQAMTNNFDASEISDDLKKQYVQLAEQTYQIQGDIVPNEQNIGEVNNEVQCQATDISQMQTSVGSDSEISYENLLTLAKEQKSITVQYEGRAYSCNYQQVEQLIKFMSSEKTAVNDSNVNANEQVESYFLGPPVAQEATGSYIVQNQIYTPINNFENNDNIVPMAAQVPILETPVQPTHLPTTVLLMIEEDSQQSQSQSAAVSYNENYTETEDYSENVKDLPSLSFTEDDTNIFEKKRRIMQ